MKGSYGYVFVVLRPTKDRFEDLVSKLYPISTYLIMSYEPGQEDKHPHLQCYVYLNREVKFHAFRRLIEKAWCTPAKGSPKNNRMYCSKTENPEFFHESGVLESAQKHYLAHLGR